MKKALFILLLASAVGIGGVSLLFQSAATPAPDNAAINDAVMSGADVSELLRQEYERMNAENLSREIRLRAFLYSYICVLAVAGLYLYLYCERSIIAPFRNLQRFARDIAMGNLDIPLEMDRHGSFGAFTESFDLMRAELKEARENERAADRSKKELVASLSHDIKTPVASIKAATELMLVTAKDDKEKQLLERVGEKAEQINTLITDMFHATLEELQALSVTVSEIHSTAIPDLIQNADYRGKVKPFTVPDCIVMADAIRLQQVFDNIIGNSYKYAGTDIEIRANFDGGYLAIDIMDCGSGVPDDELPLLSGKFYRGKNADAKSGYGLGLYISKYLITHMSGEMRCENRKDGFTVRLLLKLA